MLSGGVPWDPQSDRTKWVREVEQKKTKRISSDEVREVISLAANGKKPTDEGLAMAMKWAADWVEGSGSGMEGGIGKKAVINLVDKYKAQCSLSVESASFVGALRPFWLTLRNLSAVSGVALCPHSTTSRTKPSSTTLSRT